MERSYNVKLTARPHPKGPGLVLSAAVTGETCLADTSIVQFADVALLHAACKRANVPFVEVLGLPDPAKLHQLSREQLASLGFELCTDDTPDGVPDPMPDTYELKFLSTHSRETVDGHLEYVHIEACTQPGEKPRRMWLVNTGDLVTRLGPLIQPKDATEIVAELAAGRSITISHRVTRQQLLDQGFEEDDLG